ncbi:hypothetical protein D3C75_1064500 [compost metagenome]
MDAGTGLFAGAGFGQLALDGGLAGQVRVSVDQRQLVGVVGAEQDVAHALVQRLDLVQLAQLAQVVGFFGNPRRVLVDVGEGLDEGVTAQGGWLEGVEGGHQAFSFLYGWVACQWRAMSTRRANQTWSWLFA